MTTPSRRALRRAKGTRTRRRANTKSPVAQRAQRAAYRQASGPVSNPKHA